MGAHTLAETYGLGPFHAGGGGGGGGSGGGGCSATTHVLEAGSNTVPSPQTAAALTPEAANTPHATGASAATAPIAKRPILLVIVRTSPEPARPTLRVKRIDAGPGWIRAESTFVVGRCSMPPADACARHSGRPGGDPVRSSRRAPPRRHAERVSRSRIAPR